MAGSVNKVILIGNLGKDPEVRRLNSGDQVVSFSVATSETWRDKSSGERKERTEWHNVVIFNENLGKVAEQYCKKGTKVYLEGQLQTRKWQDQSGADRYTTEVVLQRFRGELQLLDFAWRRRRSRQLPRGRGSPQLGLQPRRDQRPAPSALRRGQRWRGADRRRHSVLTGRRREARRSDRWSGLAVRGSATGLDVTRPASEILHRGGSLGRRRRRPTGSREVDFTNNSRIQAGITSASRSRASSASARRALTENSAMSHWACAWPDGRLFASTSLDFDRPRRIGPIHCGGDSDRSRLTRTRAKSPMTGWRK